MGRDSSLEPCYFCAKSSQGSTESRPTVLGKRCAAAPQRQDDFIKQASSTAIEDFRRRGVGRGNFRRGFCLLVGFTICGRAFG